MAAHPTPADRHAHLTHNLEQLTHLANSTFLADLTRAHREWTGRGYPTGGQGTRTTNPTSRTEHAATTPDPIAHRLTLIDQDLHTLTNTIRRLTVNARWLAPLDHTTAQHLTRARDQCRIDGCTDDADPGHAGHCSACHEYVRRNGKPPTPDTLTRRWQLRTNREHQHQTNR